MFDGMAEQFYQFLAARTTTPPTNNIPTTSLPLSFTLHNHTNNAHHHHFPTYSSSPTQQQHTFDASYHHLLQQHHHHPHFLTRHNNVIKDDDDEDDESTAGLDPSHHHSAAAADLQTQQHVHTTTTLHDASQTSLTMLLPEIPWSNDEMLALFRIRSSVDNTWFPDYIWETVSRKLAELGFKRSAEKCKEKFEEETRSFNSSIISNCNNNNNNSNKNNNNNNYRLFHELEELCNNNSNNANNTMNGSDDHVSLQQQHPLLAPTTLAPSERDQFSQPPLSRKDQCLDGDEEDDENNEDGEDDLGMDDEGDNAGGERLGDDEEEEEEEEGGDHTRNDENKNNVRGDEAQSVDDSEKTEENTKRGVRKRKRQKKFEMFKGFCEKIVNEMMAQQQQLHYKILQDMVKRDEEKIAKEEAWKKQEIERLEKELEVRAHEQAIAGDRQAKIFDFLNKFSTSSSNVLDTHSLRDTLEKLNKVPNFTSSNNSSILSQDSIISAPLQPTSSCTTHDDTHTPPLVNHQTSCPDIIPISSSNENLALLSPIRLESSKLAPRLSSSSMDQASQNPNLVISHNDSPTPPPSVVSSSKKFSRPDHTSTDATEHVTNSKTLEDQNDTTPVVRSGKDDTGRRWPRDEVLALINIRCSLFNNNNNGSGGEGHNDKEGFSKGPLWERISHKMTELGYKRSAKRCKEKWENINKYFRKTKDMNKKRSIDSRTCPYFHQLSHLYSQGTLVGPTDRPADLPGSPETRPGVAFSVTQGGSNTPANDANNSMHTSQGNEGVVQVPGFDFEF